MMRPTWILATTLALTLLVNAELALADEGGISFWLPGQYGSFAAPPGESGWSWATVYYHGSVGADADRVFPRGGRIVAGLDGTANLLLFGPTYTSPSSVLGGQLALTMMAVGGRNTASVDAVLTGPKGNSVVGTVNDARTGFGDLYPTATLKWTDGVHNYMTYLAGSVPAGAYSADRLANLGIGHGAIDAGGGYTYFNPATGREASAVLGFTYNLENAATHYKNGIDMHVDFAVSQFLDEQVFVGGAGYFYQQITGDSGAGATLGDFKSRVAGIGPQIGYLFSAGAKLQGALNAKAYWEFAGQNRPEGWNLWIAVTFAPAAKPRQ